MDIQPCVDGVVLVADRKITIVNNDGLNFDYKKKLFAELRHVVFGSSGSTGNYELFRGHLKSRIRKNHVLIDDICLVLSDITYTLNERYKYVTKQCSTFCSELRIKIRTHP